MVLSHGYAPTMISKLFSSLGEVVCIYFNAKYEGKWNNSEKIVLLSMKYDS
ncbi:Uncharacterised protein [Yersinia enterocolitica]|nr:Uncharacterised protein [Yersinia enterocolitica]CQR20749.1 Uncharacterised protein [Yersinia enterocolitica]